MVVKLMDNFTRSHVPLENTYPGPSDFWQNPPVSQPFLIIEEIFYRLSACAISMYINKFFNRDFINSPQYKNDNISNFVLAVPLKINKTNGIYIHSPPIMPGCCISSQEC